MIFFLNWSHVIFMLFNITPLSVNNNKTIFHLVKIKNLKSSFCPMYGAKWGMFNKMNKNLTKHIFFDLFIILLIPIHFFILYFILTNDFMSNKYK